MTCSISVFGAILVVTAVTPTIVVAIALLGIVYYRVQVSHPSPHAGLLVFWCQNLSRQTVQQIDAIPAQT